METIEGLKEENHELKRALAICMNEPLIRQLNEAIIRIDNGEYVSEEEFFKSSPQ